MKIYSNDKNGHYALYMVKPFKIFSGAKRRFLDPGSLLAGPAYERYRNFLEYLEY